MATAWGLVPAAPPITHQLAGVATPFTEAIRREVALGFQVPSAAADARDAVAPDPTLPPAAPSDNASSPSSVTSCR